MHQPLKRRSSHQKEKACMARWGILQVWCPRIVRPTGSTGSKAGRLNQKVGLVMVGDPAGVLRQCRSIAADAVFETEWRGRSGGWAHPSKPDWEGPKKCAGGSPIPFGPPWASSILFPRVPRGVGSPSVRSIMATFRPFAARWASVPPQRISRSSGWAPTATTSHAQCQPIPAG